MNYANIKPRDIANGPGIRVSLFVSGCTHRCPGCFNAEAWDFSYGQPFDQAVIDRILADLAPDFISGLTLLGGEPFDHRNQNAVLDLLRQVKSRYPEKSIWAFTGYIFDRDLLPGKVGDASVTREYLEHLDVLVDGPFVEAEKNLTLRFRGSANQRIIDVPASLAKGAVVLWEDWQGDGRGLK